MKNLHSWLKKRRKRKFVKRMSSFSAEEKQLFFEFIIGPELNLQPHISTLNADQRVSLARSIIGSLKPKYTVNFAESLLNRARSRRQGKFRVNGVIYDNLKHLSTNSIKNYAKKYLIKDDFKELIENLPLDDLLICREWLNKSIKLSRKAEKERIKLEAIEAEKTKKIVRLQQQPKVQIAFSLKDIMEEKAEPTPSLRDLSSQENFRQRHPNSTSDKSRLS